jgi:hypothetical protein
VPDATDYVERLSVPLRWWVQTTMLLATVWLAFVVAMPFWVASGCAAGLLLVTYGMFAWIGSVRISVHDGVLAAGRARIRLEHLGTSHALDPDETRRALGVDADARAFLVTRPYLKRSVKVDLDDPRDPTPYWVLSSRHPERLVTALDGRRPGGTP